MTGKKSIWGQKKIYLWANKCGYRSPSAGTSGLKKRERNTLIIARNNVPNIFEIFEIFEVQIEAKRIMKFQV